MPISPWQKLAGGYCALVLMLLCSGCSGSGLNEVQGVVKYQGAPIKGAVVIFRPKAGGASAQSPSGITREDGTFTLSTGTTNGAPVGDYIVSVTWPEEAGPPRFKKGTTEMEDITLPDRLKGRYAKPEASGLSVTIKSGKNKLEPFDLN